MRRGFSIALAALCALAASPAMAEGKYGPGASDTEIKLGQTMPYSGPVSSWAPSGKTQMAFFEMLNSKGGINGRKVRLLSLDDGYLPPKTLEQTRKLVESDNVLAIVGNIGTPTNTAIQKYLNRLQVPHILIATGASKWNDPKHFPYTIPGGGLNQAESGAYATYVLRERPNAKIAVLYQNDDLGRDYLEGMKKGLGDKAASMIVATASYEATDPTIDSQISMLHGSGADVLLDISTPKFAAQAIRKVADLGWKPLHFVTTTANSIAGALEPAGLDKSTGLLTSLLWKTPSDPRWQNDKDMQDYLTFMKQWYPDTDAYDIQPVSGYVTANLTAIILRNCGDDLTRENIIRQTTSLRDQVVPMLVPGVTVTITPDDYTPYHKINLARFDGKTWAPLGMLIDVKTQAVE
jgi:ABC-type branched-subunit amino acid transport system substrate-binding protein